MNTAFEWLYSGIKRIFRISDKGIYIPKYTQTEINTIAAGLTTGDNGLVFYNTTKQRLECWNGTNNDTIKQKAQFELFNDVSTEITNTPKIVHSFTAQNSGWQTIIINIPAFYRKSVGIAFTTLAIQDTITGIVLLNYVVFRMSENNSYYIELISRESCVGVAELIQGRVYNIVAERHGTGDYTISFSDNSSITIL